jgi:hypothetical protein
LLAKSDLKSVFWTFSGGLLKEKKQISISEVSLKNYQFINRKNGGCASIFFLRNVDILGVLWARSDLKTAS